MDIPNFRGYTNEFTYYFSEIAMNNEGLYFLWKSTTEEWIENAFESPIDNLKGFRQTCIEAVADELHEHYDDVLANVEKHLETLRIEQDYPEIFGFVHIMLQGYKQIDWRDITGTYVDMVASESNYLPEPWLPPVNDVTSSLTDTGEMFHD